MDERYVMNRTKFLEICASRPWLEVRSALKNGSDPNTINKYGVSALMLAASKNPHGRTTRILIEYGADVNARCLHPEMSGYTPLIMAAREAVNPEGVMALIEAGADIDARGGDGRTALIAAAEMNENTGVLLALLRGGADVNAQDENGNTALILAAEKNPNAEIVRQLILYEAGVNAVCDGYRGIGVVRDSPRLPGTDTLTRPEAIRLRERGPGISSAEDFLAALNVSPSTRSIYRKKIRCFFAWLGARGIQRPERGDILAWRDELVSSGRRPVTVSNYLLPVCKFFRWAHKKGLCGDIAEGIAGPRVARDFRDDTLTGEQLRKMLDSIDRGDITGLRDYALLSLIVSCSLSYAEVSKAKIEDIEVNGEGASLSVGGGRVRVPDEVMTALREYWAARGDAGPESPVFDGGRTHKRQPMSVRAIGAVLKDTARKANMDMVVFTPASLRHTAVKLALGSGRRIEDVRKFARHRYIGTTHRYSVASGKRGHTCGDTIAAELF